MPEKPKPQLLEISSVVVVVGGALDCPKGRAGLGLRGLGLGVWGRALLRSRGDVLRRRGPWENVGTCSIYTGMMGVLFSALLSTMTIIIRGPNCDLH